MNKKKKKEETAELMLYMATFIKVCIYKNGYPAVAGYPSGPSWN